MAKGRVKEKKNIGIFQYGWVGGVMGSFSNIKKINFQGKDG